MAKNTNDITVLLIEWNNGNEDAKKILISIIYKELHKLAQHYMKREASNHTLQATALVNEVYIKLINQKEVIENRGHFLALAATQMRRILVDHARGKNRNKRGKGTIFLSLDEEKEATKVSGFSTEDFLALDIALDSLAKLDSIQSRIIEMKFFAGLTIEEIGKILNISSATVEREWKVAKLWLHSKLKPLVNS